ncbi:MAG: DNA topoisomerase III, partial [Lentisphaerae bacterium]|nr:DNA topoisomerase III [Lentisphaerota bacterium]
MKVVLAEKPSQGKDYAKALGCTENHDGYINGNGFAVTWAIGHLVSMVKPEAMRQAGSFSDLPVIEDNPQFEIVKDKERQFAVIESLFNDPDTEEIICGTDAGREGEHIFRLIYEKTGCTKPIKRLWISSLTDKAVKKGFESLQPGDDFNNLAAAAMCRARADMLVGLNFSIAHSIHNSMMVATGRVMTPTLALLVQRELDIQTFTEKFYYEIMADIKEGFKAKYINTEGQHSIDDKKAAMAIYDTIKDAKTA